MKSISIDVFIYDNIPYIMREIQSTLNIQCKTYLTRKSQTYLKHKFYAFDSFFEYCS